MHQAGKEWYIFPSVILLSSSHNPEEIDCTWNFLLDHLLLFVDLDYWIKVSASNWSVLEGW